MSNKIKRTILSISDTLSEVAAINAMGFSQLLLVTGEHETKVGMEYFERTIDAIRDKVSYLMMEVQPLTLNHYKTLKEKGLDAVLVYQRPIPPALRQYTREVKSRIFVATRSQ